MRERNNIEDELFDVYEVKPTSMQGHLVYKLTEYERKECSDRLFLEVLLDIRSLLQNFKETIFAGKVKTTNL